MSERPTIVCLCGSMKFQEWFFEAQRLEALAGRIVVAPAFFSNADQAVLPEEVLRTLATLHRHKIDLAEEILVMDVDGYIGEATQGEIAYAAAANKKVRYWSAEVAGEPDQEASTSRPPARHGRGE